MCEPASQSLEPQVASLFWRATPFFLFFLFNGVLNLTLKGHCHEDFAVLGQFCAKIITLRL